MAVVLKAGLIASRAEDEDYVVSGWKVEQVACGAGAKVCVASAGKPLRNDLCLAMVGATRSCSASAS